MTPKNGLHRFPCNAVKGLNMKAIRIEHAIDDYSGLTIVDRQEPIPEPGQLRVAMKKAALHPSDLNYIRGDYYKGLERLIWNSHRHHPSFDPNHEKPHPTLPFTPGAEGVGIVDACGDGIDQKQWLGKRVALLAGPPNGTWQQSLLCQPNQLAMVPSELPDEQAALMMLNPLTTLVMVRYILNIQQGQWLLQSAGNSTVAKMVATLGKHFGFHTISIVRLTPPGGSMPLADVVINSQTDNIAEAVLSATAGKGADKILDCVGGSLTEQMVQCLGDHGQMLLYGTLEAPSFNIHARDLMMTNGRLSGFYLPGWLNRTTPDVLQSVMKELAQLSGLGLFRSEIADQYPITDVKKAITAALTPGRNGKILIDMV